MDTLSKMGPFGSLQVISFWLDMKFGIGIKKDMNEQNDITSQQYDTQFKSFDGLRELKYGYRTNLLDIADEVSRNDPMNYFTF